MAIREVKVTAKSIDKRETAIKRISKILLLLLLFLIILFSLLTLVYRGGDFVITLDPNFSIKSGLKMYNEIDLKHDKIKLYAKSMDFMDNISIKWLPKDIHDSAGGSHNGENYIAYTFYMENTGDKNIDYWYEILIVDVIKNVDEAIRIMVIKNDETTVYAKVNDLTKKAEKDTTLFYSNKIPVLEQRKDMKPGEMDKFTIVIWLEGDDPDCLDNIIGGEIKVSMQIIESHVELKGKENEKE